MLLGLGLGLGLGLRGTGPDLALSWGGDLWRLCVSCSLRKRNDVES